MEFRSKVNTFLQTLGEAVTLSVDGTEYAVHALVQPMRYKNKLYLEQERTELGFKDSECFLYLGPSNPDIAGMERKTIVKTVDRCYNVSRADRISLKGKTQYIWAILTPRIKDGEYDEL